MDKHEFANKLCNEFHELEKLSQLATNFKTIKQGELVYVVHFDYDRFAPRIGIYEYTKDDGNLGITYISPFDRNDAEPRTISCVPNKDVFLTEKDCQDYINSYWYHGKCKTCKYDKYSTEHTCFNCKHKVMFENLDEFNTDPPYYCDMIYKKCNIKIQVASGYVKQHGFLICNQFNPSINNGDWINFHWYMEVLKNCWCNTDEESSCPAKRTVCRGASFKRELHKPNNISIRLLYQEHEYIVHSYIPYYQWLKQTFIQSNKIFVDTISIETSRNTKTVKYKDIEVKEFLNLTEIENIVKENI